VEGIETIKFLEGIGAPFMLIVGLLLLAWITRKAGGFGPVLHTESKFHSTGEFIRFFIPALTGMVGFWSTVALKHSGFHALRKIAESANGGAGAGASNGYDALCVHRRGGHFRVSGAVRCADLGSCRAAWQI